MPAVATTTAQWRDIAQKAGTRASEIHRMAGSAGVQPHRTSAITPNRGRIFYFSQIEQKNTLGHHDRNDHHSGLEREALRSKLKRRNQEFQTLRDQYIASLKASEATISTLAETTYLHIVGALLSLMLGRTPFGQPYSQFKTEEAIVTALISHCGELTGITERTLHSKFAAASANSPEIERSSLHLQPC
jgi:hypothetical protein